VSSRILILLPILGCSFSVDPVIAEIPPDAGDSDMHIGPVDDLSEVPDLTQVSDDLTCSNSCVGVVCGQLNGCGTMCCADAGCAPVSCDPQCQLLTACGSGCPPVANNTFCVWDLGPGTCQSGGCTPGALEHSVYSKGGSPASSSLAPDSQELGMKFTYDNPGVVTKLRFFKPAGASGTHVGHLWDGAGTLLATANYGTETASGWQEVTLSTPVPITAGTPYVVSYAEHGGFAFTSHGFDTGVDAPPLHVPAFGGTYQRPEGTFPSLVWFNSNFWLDVVVVDQ
jgi:Domain of unknown function (DUF4082)